MKKETFIRLFGILLIAFMTACAKPSYFGNTYPPTSNVDVYLDKADIRKQYTTMGSTTLDKGFGSIESTQQKVIEMGKSKGADGVIMTLTEDVVVTQQNGTAIASKTKKDKVIANSSSQTRDIKETKIIATFIKYIQ
ncbi:hypothetical protein [Chitinophaga silvisoli]|uniref:DUF4156 domain-containing protein n=1 Tax=Chitinophaga silvisoli TaxID=2291814 RepID=A0A3E1PAW2_9BACT|nr:hypothetical protein [Chitinophaga silvisoli]RFM37118.1 hypothetical protein DXN04_05045 [Chitinophaga silvisoli]